MELILTLAAMVLFLLLEGFFSGSEIGVVSADQMKLRHAAAKGSRGARLALEMLKRPEWLLSTTLVGTNIAVVTNTTLATALTIEYLGERWSWLAIVFVAPLIWIFGEIVPKSIFQQRADTITPRAIFLLKFASYVFAPILIVFSAVTRILTRLLGGSGDNPFTLREEIITMLALPATSGDIGPAEHTMIRRMFDFSETTVEKVMVPLIDVTAIEQNATCNTAFGLAAKHQHVRMPVYAGRIDKIVGVLHTLDLLGLDPAEPIAPHVRPARYVPGAKSNEALLLELREEGNVIAIVVNEFGGARGIVTIEDIMEEIVEEIEDEYDAGGEPSQWVRKISEREYVVSARIELNRLEERLGLQLTKGNYTTLAG